MSKIEITLLPAKEFIIHVDDKEIPGKFGTWTLNRYCLKKNLSLSDLDAALKPDSISMDDIATFILCSIEYGCRKKNLPFHYDDVWLFELSEQMGGFFSEKFQSLMKHAHDDKEDTGEEKKIEEGSMNGVTSNETSSLQD